MIMTPCTLLNKGAVIKHQDDVEQFTLPQICHVNPLVKLYGSAVENVNLINPLLHELDDYLTYLF